MVFLNSAINPLAYGYGNETMQKAFRITFPFLFKGKVSKKHYKNTFWYIFFLSPNSNYKKESIVSSPSQESCQRSIPMLKPKFKKVSRMLEQILWLQSQQNLKRVQLYLDPKGPLENLPKELQGEQAVWLREELLSKLQIHPTVSLL